MNIICFLIFVIVTFICLRACKICVVFAETKPESNSHKLRKVFSSSQIKVM